MSVIEIKNLNKDYGNNKGIFDISFKIEKGEVFGFLGPNGAGKTTTIRHLLGFIFAKEGNCSILGMDCGKQAATIQKELGYIPGEINLWEEMSGMQFLKFMAKFRGMKDMGRCEELMERFKLDPSGRIKKMSKGMKQKVGIVAAFMHDPQILILDEPTAGLDPKERVRFRNLISDFAKEKIVILSTHIVSDVSYIADYILMMKNGRFLLGEPMETVTDHIKGKVWEILIDNREAGKYSRDFSVVSLRHENNMVRLRIVSDTAPAADAVAVEPSLEDLFLYHFGENAQSERSNDYAD